VILAFALAIGSAVLWQEPGRIEAVDFSKVETEPKAPYIFLREDLHGTSPKVYVRDANGVEWRVKGGRDTMPEAFITRFVSALGYYAETTVFSARGRIEGVPPLKRASGFIKSDGSYTWASFEKMEKDARFIGSWSWIDPALKNNRELKGLKVLVMLFSNWDNKDKRDAYKGSNTSILELANGRLMYFVNDWGQSLGSWGRLFGRMNWDCDLFAKQTPEFVLGVHDGAVRFGYSGGHTLRFRDDIRVEDVNWLMQYLGRITDAQIRMGLKASGASSEQEECFSRELRSRIEQLRKITLQ
jgi:hypothetical protein